MRAYFNPSSVGVDMVDAATGALQDLSVPMEEISRVMLADTRKVFDTGLSSWAPLSEATVERWGMHPILARVKRPAGVGPPLRDQLERDWSKANAAVINRAPHAHLQQYGTRQYETARYDTKVTVDGKQKRHRQSRTEVAAHKKKFGSGSEHSPMREFVFVREESFPRFADIILDYFADEIDEAA